MRRSYEYAVLRFAQDRESFDPAQDRELVERLVEWQMDFLQSHHQEF